MKYLLTFNEKITLDIEVGDELRGGRFKNKKVIVKKIGKDDENQPTINGKTILKYKIKKIIPKKENMENRYTMYSGISLKAWETIWKDKKLTNRETNVTDNKSFAFDYSYDFNTGTYDDVIVEISNIPLDAFVAYRVYRYEDEYSDEEDNDNYQDDDDFHSMNNMNENEKKNILDTEILFLVNLYAYKDEIKTKLIKRNEK
ncbi:hypothetical protein M0Q97_10310 [Candidatus Dojkabacteria bacterium]|jgi:hypothetical protein|nr:hypothetical protein [Candidatus Dojkabacteria bacterium]